MEILAPAGGPEQLRAAVLSGADAVYLGLSDFSARAAAVNFGAEELKEAVAFCHERGVKVHAAINTLVTDDELDAAYETLKTVCLCGVDAVIAQDLAVAKMVRECAPSLALHASTQMSVHDTEGVRALEKLGFTRVVLARELTLREIADIAKQTPLETEVFIHGALCMCVSGMCYLSSMLGGRSGNRGRCAQPCRLDFRCGGRGHALSLKDLSAVTRFKELEAAGVCSVKIEGRMKRPEYVAGAVDACLAEREGRTPDLERLRAVFSRSGFTDGYLTGRRTLDMFGTREKEDVTAAAAALSPLRLLYKDERPRIGVDFSLDIPAGTLSASDGTHSVTARTDAAEPAKTTPTDRERAAAAIGKTGGTPYFVRGFDFKNDGLVLPVSALNALRREALGGISEQRQKIAPLPCAPLFAMAKRTARPAEPALRLRFERVSQICMTQLAERVILPVSALEHAPELIGRLGQKLVCELPALCFDAQALEARLRSIIKLGLRQVQCDGLGTLMLARRLGLTLHGGAGLNILNSAALDEYAALGLADATVSFELAREKICALGGSLPRGVLVYGRLPLMRFRACPKNDCARCAGHDVLTDRLGLDFPLLCSERVYQTLYNSLPLWAADKGPFGVDFVTLSFTDEREGIAEIIEACLGKRPAPGKHTNGLYLRELQ